MRDEEFDEDAPGELIPSEGHLAFRPDPIPTDIKLTPELVNALTSAHERLGRLSAIGERVYAREELLSPFIHKEAVNSSEIEGTHVTISDVYLYETRNANDDIDDETASSSSERLDQQEVSNYVNAVNEGIDALQDDERITTELICSLHETLLSGTRGQDKYPGQLRTIQAIISKEGRDSIRFVPSPPSNVSYDMQNLEQFMNLESPYTDLIDIGLIHYQFETIHPFHDGNGRMGRLLIMLLMSDRDILPEPYLYPSSYFNRYRDEYIDHLLAVSQHGEWEPWLQFFVHGIEDMADEAYRRGSELLDLRDTYQETYQGGASSVFKLTMMLFSEPIITVSQASDRIGSTYQTTNRAVDQLVSDGVLNEITGNKRNREFMAEEILEIVKKPSSQLKMSGR